MNNLQQRLRDVFSLLEPHDPNGNLPAWSLSDEAVRVPGRESASESDGDDAGDDDHEECVEVLRMVEEEEGDATMGCKMPSSAACQAFSQEDEEDAFDRLACESLQRLRCRPKPALKTQVAERNIYDRMMLCSPSPSSPTCPANTPTLAQLTAPTPAKVNGSVRKKVRFREEDEFCDAPPAVNLADADCPMQREAGPSPQLRQKLSSGNAASTAPRETDAGFGGNTYALVPSTRQSNTRTGKSMSYVPEHVRRPEAFTCYELDTPVVVGSGVDGSADALTASDQTMVSTTSGRVFSGINSPLRRNRDVQGCLKQSAARQNVLASNMRFAGLPAAEYLHSAQVTAQQRTALSAGASTSNREIVEDDAEPPEMVAFVPGKSSKARGRSSVCGRGSEMVPITGEQVGEARAQLDGAAAGCSSAGANSQRAERSRGVLSVTGEEDDVMDDRAETRSQGVMQLASGTLGSALAGGLSSLGGVEAEPVSMRDGAMTFEFPMDASQPVVDSVGVFGGGVGFLSTPVNRGQQKNRRGRRQLDD